MMNSPKDRVRANIYKTLLEEEKKKGKKKSMLSLSLFVVGMFTGVSYKNLNENTFSENKFVAFEKKEGMSRKEVEFAIEDLFQPNEIKVKKKDFNSENLFVSDLQI